MINNLLRQGNFNSSEIVALTTNGKEQGTFGKPFYTFIEECNMERRLGTSIETEISARALSWGNLCERYVFQEKLGTEYTLESKETLVHPEIDFWVGSPDGRKYDEGGTVTDTKAPFTKKSFCQLVHPLYCGLNGMDAMNAIRFGFKDKESNQHEKHKDGEKFYWQLGSNACILGTDYAELIAFIPYKNELEAIRELASQVDDPEEQKKYYWIAQASDDELPWIPEGGFYQNLNIIRFKVPLVDKLFLKQRVIEGGKKLIKRVSIRV